MADLFMSGFLTGKIVLISGLLLGSLIDINNMTVPLPLVIFMGALGWGIRVINGNFWEWGTLCSLIPGFLLLAYAKISREKIGMGDAWVIIAMGTLLDFQNVISVTMWAFWAAGVLAFIVLVIMRRREMEIPFLPFLFLGYAIHISMN